MVQERFAFDAPKDNVLPPKTLAALPTTHGSYKLSLEHVGGHESLLPLLCERLSALTIESPLLLKHFTDENSFT